MDAWQGYPPSARTWSHTSRKVSNVAFLTGDFHTFLAGDVRPRRERRQASAVAPEFQSGSITSQGLGEGRGRRSSRAPTTPNPNTNPAIVDALKPFNPWVHDADLDHHGYGHRRGSATS